ncbi:head-tail connector protein [Sphingobium yanoikuyae]|uniref:head-tail connector protein n=1 Tax=Sphingobium yanoikuyae TaxID=13690 RepID=UPI00242EFC68|nr:head-tail connector protein [Sphingobium yanoikuyae]
MPIISLAVAREHLRVGAEVSDARMTELVNGAEGIVSGFMQRPITGEGGWQADAIPAVVIEAIKVAIVELYDNPGAPLVDEDVLRVLVGYYSRPSFA